MQIDWIVRQETFGDPDTEHFLTFASSMLMLSRTSAGILRRPSVIMREKRHDNTAMESLMPNTGDSYQKLLVHTVITPCSYPDLHIN